MAAERRRGAALALLLWGTSVIAAVPRAPATDDAIVAQATALAQADDCPGVLRLLDPLVGRVPPGATATRFSAQILRMPCLAAVGRGDEVAPVLAELKAKAPTHPLVLGFQVFVDAAQNRPAAAADGLAALADTGSRALRLMPGALWRSLAQQLTVAHDTARRDRTALALARAGWMPADRPELGETLAVDGIGTLLDQQDPDQARALLVRVKRPGALWAMAIERRYAALWPAIEARLGPASGKAADAYATAALARFGDRPDDEAARLEAVRAFGALGRADDVIATAATVAVAPGMSEDAVEMVTDDAQAHAALGDRPAALARLAPFATLDMRATPQAAAALIALAEGYHDAGRFADELAVARAGLAIGQGAFSAFGVQWLRRDEVCALAGLHRDGEMKTAADALAAAQADNQAAAVEGLLCAGRDDEAARIAIAGFATADGADRLADQFQPEGALFLPAHSTLRPLWTKLLARGDVRAAFDRGARVLPQALWPAKAPRPLPAPRDAVDATSA